MKISALFLAIAIVVPASSSAKTFSPISGKIISEDNDYSQYTIEVEWICQSGIFGENRTSGDIVGEIDNQGRIRIPKTKMEECKFGIEKIWMYNVEFRKGKTLLLSQTALRLKKLKKSIKEISVIDLSHTFEFTSDTGEDFIQWMKKWDQRVGMDIRIAPKKDYAPTWDRNRSFSFDKIAGPHHFLFAFPGNLKNKSLYYSVSFEARRIRLGGWYSVKTDAYTFPKSLESLEIKLSQVNYSLEGKWGYLQIEEKIPNTRKENNYKFLDAEYKCTNGNLEAYLTIRGGDTHQISGTCGKGWGEFEIKTPIYLKPRNINDKSVLEPDKTRKIIGKVRFHKVLGEVAKGKMTNFDGRKFKFSMGGVK